MREQHGMTDSSEYRIWTNIMTRCSNPKAVSFRNYGGRGITVCERWKASFLAFYEDMGQRPDGHQIDRIDNDGNYEPANCRWVSVKAQAYNRRTNVRVSIDGIEKTLGEWSESAGLRYATIWRRYSVGDRGHDLLKPLHQGASL